MSKFGKLCVTMLKLFSVFNSFGCGCHGDTLELEQNETEIRAEIANLFSTMISKNSLHFEEECDERTELNRTAILKFGQLQSISQSRDQFGPLQGNLSRDVPLDLDLKYKLEEANKIPGQFCNFFQNLICVSGDRKSVV